MRKQIAIDGPAGAGKSTVARAVAQKLGYVYIDTGAMYRAMALYFLRKGIDAQDCAAIEAVCDGADITISHEDGEQQVFLNGENVSKSIRTQEVSQAASVVSAVPKVRERMLVLQRRLAQTKDVVMDGRDIGTCVLPDAPCKIFLTARVSERARRRFEEYVAKGEAADLATIEREIAERDERDRTRKISPLRQAQDAVCVDTSDMTIAQVIERVLAIAGGSAWK